MEVKAKAALIAAAGALGVLGIIMIARKVSAGQCYTVDNIGTGPDEPYYYARYYGQTLPIIDAFGDTNQDIFMVHLFINGFYQQATVYDTIEKGQKFRFQVVRTTEICHIKLESL